MRTTLDIDDDVLLAAKDLARRQRKTAGEVLSELARLGLQGGSVAWRSRRLAMASRRHRRLQTAPL